MKRNTIITFFLLVGMAIFSYPFIANMVSTTGHVQKVKGYEEMMEKVDKKQKKAAEELAQIHNEEIKKGEQIFVDPFESGTESVGSQSYYDALNLGEVIAVLKIPKLNLELPIYHGSNEKVLSKGVGHLENSALPIGGTGTHSVLTAHRGLPTAKLFRHLDKLKNGDVFFVEVLDETHAYEVFNEKIVLPNETEWLTQDEDKELMTLLTCEPYMINTHRLLVTGKRIPYDEKVKEIHKNASNSLSKLYMLAGAGLSLFILLIIYLVYRYKKNTKKNKRGKK
ncbi:class C sortase [Vagococcus sp. JNUCC 83]